MKKILSVLLLTLLFATLAGPIPVQAAGRCYVNINAAGSNNGTSWTNAYTDLQSALSDTCTEIWVAEGTYTPHTSNRDVSFELKNGVALYGGFTGIEPNLEERNWTINSTILSGDIDSGENSYHVITSSGVGSSAILDGFTITAGQANGGSGNDLGGGMYNNGGSPTIRNIIFQGNTTSQEGGGLYNDSGSPSITNVFFIENSANWGAALYNDNGSSPNITNAVFFKNVAATGGGGLYNKAGSSATIFNATFYGNQVTENHGLDGGAILLEDSTITVTNAILWGNIINPNAEESRAQIAYKDENSTSDVAYSIVQGGWPGVEYDNLDADPRFVNAAGGNLRLQGASPALDSGTNTGCPTGDIEGRVRPQIGPSGNNTCDMGAYEMKISDFEQIDVEIGGDPKGTYYLSSGTSMQMNYAGLFGGPVIVENSNSVPIIAGLRDLWTDDKGSQSSYTQILGMPISLLSYKYVFPTYSNVVLNEQLRIANVGTESTNVTVTIGGQVQGDPITLQPNQQYVVNYPGLFGGPIIVEGSKTNVPIIADLRDLWTDDTGNRTSYSQIFGMPVHLLSYKYVFPTYSNVVINEQLRIANVGTESTNVTVTIGGQVQGDPITLQPNQQYVVNYPGLFGGPIIVEGSKTNVPIIAGLRDL
ncbi:MAG: hypothetical protein L6461_07490 [Anaerolineae bacterium]|nr:hypothetical protein [Anaerolineae bacterium]